MLPSRLDVRFCERRKFGSENGSVVYEQSCLSTDLDDFIANVLAFSVAIKPEEQDVAVLSSGYKVRLDPVLLTSLLCHLFSRRRVQVCGVATLVVPVEIKSVDVTNNARHGHLEKILENQCPSIFDV